MTGEPIPCAPHGGGAVLGHVRPKGKAMGAREAHSMAWHALPNAALGVMIEVLETRSPWCKAIGHRPVWRADALVCGRPGCRQAFPHSTRAIREEFASLEGLALIADELNARRAA